MGVYDMPMLCRMNSKVSSDEWQERRYKLEQMVDEYNKKHNVNLPFEAWQIIVRLEEDNEEVSE